jgi:hypothetical protein
MRAALCVVVLGIVAAGVCVSAQYEKHDQTGELNRALGVECTHCHVDGRWAVADRTAYATAARMIKMVGEVNALLSQRGATVTCWSCHAGQRVPSRLPRAAWERVRAAWPAAWASASEDVKLTMAVYTASTGRTCAGCHEDGTGAATEEAVTLVKLMNSLFPVMEKHLPERAVTQCYMCHKGRPHPERAPHVR